MGYWITVINDRKASIGFLANGAVTTIQSGESARVFVKAK